MDRRRVLAVAAALLLVTAGCQAPAAPATNAGPTEDPAQTESPATTDGATQTTTDATTQTTTGPAESTEYVTVSDELPYEVAPIFRRVGRMLDVPESEWPVATVDVREPPESGTTTRASTSGFTNYVGIEPLPSAGEGGGVQTGAFARGSSVVLFDHPNASNTFEQHVLAHEFVHVFQFEAGATGLQPEAAVAALDQRRARPFLKTTMVEGSAEYVQERYRIAYQNATLNQTRLTDEWKEASAYVRFRIAPYEYGSRYFAMRLANASQVPEAYDDPPETAEQVLHGYAPDGEDALPLTVTANGSGSEFESTGATTKGELFTRLALSSELNWSRSASGAAGWGMDRLQYFIGPGGSDGYAWVLRWDDASEATEFREAFAAYDDANDARFRLESVTDETVVVYAGAESFVANATAAGNSSDVTVRV